jgi:hypothetical protein
VRTPRSPDLPEGTTEANKLTSTPRTTYTGVAALRSVADMLRKRTEDSIKSIAIYRRELDKVAARSLSGSS